MIGPDMDVMSVLRKCLPKASVILSLLGVIMVAQVAGQHTHRNKTPSSARTTKQHISDAPKSAGRKVIIDGRQLVIPDVLLTDQAGKKVHFYTDLLEGKSFVLGFFFTDCTYICLRQGTLFSALQKQLGERLGKETFIISVTVNPKRDTVKRLKAWGARYGRKSGWTLVTGSVSEMDKLLMAFTGEGTGPRDIHAGFIFIANDKTGRWTLVDELTSATEMEKRINEAGLEVPNKRPQ
jgi:protein SCO1